MKQDFSVASVEGVERKRSLKLNAVERPSLSGTSGSPAVVLSAYRFCHRKHYQISTVACEQMKHYGHGSYKCKACRWGRDDKSTNAT